MRARNLGTVKLGIIDLCNANSRRVFSDSVAERPTSYVPAVACVKFSACLLIIIKNKMRARNLGTLKLGIIDLCNANSRRVFSDSVAEMPTSYVPVVACVKFSACLLTTIKNKNELHESGNGDIRYNRPL